MKWGKKHISICNIECKITRCIEWLSQKKNEKLAAHCQNWVGVSRSHRKWLSPLTYKILVRSKVVELSERSSAVLEFLICDFWQLRYYKNKFKKYPAIFDWNLVWILFDRRRISPPSFKVLNSYLKKIGMVCGWELFRDLCNIICGVFIMGNISNFILRHP
jgi:hypothetical protein